MKIRILCIGKVKERYVRDAIDDYSKRLRPYVNFEILEGSEEQAPEKLSDGEKQRILKKEGEFFLRKMGADDYNIAMAVKGKLLSSDEIAGEIEEHGMMEGRDINFLIGGSLGIAPSVEQKCHLKLSFGRITFPHQLFRAVLTEQIYRGEKIIHHEPYHK